MPAPCACRSGLLRGSRGGAAGGREWRAAAGAAALGFRESRGNWPFRIAVSKEALEPNARSTPAPTAHRSDAPADRAVLQHLTLDSCGCRVLAAELRPDVLIAVDVS